MPQQTQEEVSPVEAQAPRAQLAQVPVADDIIKSVVSNRYSQSRQAAIPFISRAAKYYRLFRNQQQTKNYQGLANLFVPEPYRIISKKTAKLSNAIKAINVTPETPKDKDAANTATHLLNFLRRKLSWNILERVAIQESRIVGMSWLKVLWNVGNESEAPYQGFDISFDTVDHVILPPDLTIQEILLGQIPWLIHDFKQDISQLRANPNYSQTAIKLLEQRTGNTGSRRNDASLLEQARSMFQQAQRAVSIEKQKKFNIQEYWGYFPVTIPDGQGGEYTTQMDVLIAVADKDVVLRKTANPYAAIIDERIPFVPIVARIVGQETYPIGDLEPCESLFNELNDTRNQRMDTVTLNIDPAKEVLRGANIDEKDLVARRGWYIKSNIPNGVRFIPPDMQGVQAAIKEEEVIRGDIQQTAGVIDFSQDSNVQAGVTIDTARGAMIAKGETDLLAEEELDLLKISLQKLYRIVLAYSQSFLDREFTMRLVEHGTESFQNVSSEQIKGNLDLDIEMQTLQDKTTQQQLKLLLLNQARETPGANVGRFFTDALESLTDGNIEISEYYEPPQPQPEPPKVSIALKGDLTQMQAAEVYKQIPGVDPHMGDPLMTSDGRLLAKGIHPEDIDILAKQHELLGGVKDRELAERDRDIAEKALDAKSTQSNSK